MIYKGKCDVIRCPNSYKWMEFDKDELIEGKEYEILDGMIMQRVYIKKDDKFIPDDSGERYRYHKVTNEQGKDILVWDGFFEGKSL